MFRWGWGLVPLLQWDRICPTIPTACGPLLCVRVPAGGAVSLRSSGVQSMLGEMMLKVFGEEKIEGGRRFVCTHGPDRPMAAGNWGQSDSRANGRDFIPEIQ